MYYRVAIQGGPSLPWQWKSTVLSSLNTLLQWLQVYRAFPKDRLRIFSSPSHEEMNEQLARVNQGLLSTSVMAAQFLHERLIGSREVAGEVMAGGTHGNEPTAPLAVAIESTSNESNWRASTLDERSGSSLEKRRVELEGGGGGDHDIPYRFTGPSSTTQVLVWMKLLVKVQDGALQP